MIELEFAAPDHTLAIIEPYCLGETIEQHQIRSQHDTVILIGRIAALKYGFEVAPEAVTQAAVRELRLLIWEREVRLSLLAALSSIPDDAIREPLTERAYA